MLDLYFDVGHEYFILGGDEGCSDKDGVAVVPGHLLVIVLFLQGLGRMRRKVVGQQREKKLEEELLTHFVVDEMKNLQEIFFDRGTLVMVLQALIEVKSGHKEEVIRCLDMTLLNSLFVPEIHSVVSCIKNGKRLAWNMASPFPINQAKMATTAHLPGRKKVIVLSQLVKQTLAKNSGTLSGAAVSLHRSKFSHIYLANWLDSININKCSSSTIFTGPVRKTVKISGCKNIILVVVARRVIIQECLDCTFFIFTPTRPVISNTCHNITFAPFATNYSDMEEHLVKAKLNKSGSNQWNKPILMAITSRRVFSFLHPSKFEIFCLPFSTNQFSIKFPLPLEYAMACKSKLDLVNKWEKDKQEASLSALQASKLDSLVKGEFNTFLESYSSQISGLKQLAGIK